MSLTQEKVGSFIFYLSSLNLSHSSAEKCNWLPSAIILLLCTWLFCNYFLFVAMPMLHNYIYISIVDESVIMGSGPTIINIWKMCILFYQREMGLSIEHGVHLQYIMWACTLLSCSYCKKENTICIFVMFEWKLGFHVSLHFNFNILIL